jgi:hypothetical protein
VSCTIRSKQRRQAGACVVDGDQTLPIGTDGNKLWVSPGQSDPRKDKRTGKTFREMALPLWRLVTSMTYMVNDRQFIVGVCRPNS